MLRKKFVQKALVASFVSLMCISPNITAYAEEEEEIIIYQQEENTEPPKEEPAQQPIQQPVQQPVQQQTQPIEQQQSEPVKKASKPVQKKATPIPTVEVSPTEAPTPSPTVTPTPEITINQGVKLEEDSIPDELVESQWTETGNTAVRWFKVNPTTTRLEIFHTKDAKEIEFAFKDSKGTNISATDECITVIPDNELEYTDLVYDIIYINEPENSGEWSISVKKWKDTKELFLVQSEIPQEWKMEKYFRTKPISVLCWFLSDKSEYKPKDILNIIEADIIPEDYESEKPIEKSEINPVKAIGAIGIVILIVIAFLLFRRYKANQEFDRLEREEGAKKRGNKHIFSEEEDYERMKEKMSELFEEEDFSDDEYYSKINSVQENEKGAMPESVNEPEENKMQEKESESDPDEDATDEFVNENQYDFDDEYEIYTEDEESQDEDEEEKGFSKEDEPDRLETESTPPTEYSFLNTQVKSSKNQFF